MKIDKHLQLAHNTDYPDMSRVSAVCKGGKKEMMEEKLIEQRDIAGNETRKEYAVRLFKSGYNCSQCVFAAFADVYGIDWELALRFSASFGGGMGRMREVCGCASAMFMVAGLETGTVIGKDVQGKKHNYEVVQGMAEAFKQRSGGSIICREILGLPKDMDERSHSPEPEKRTESYYKKRPCIQMIENACEIIEQQFGR